MTRPAPGFTLIELLAASALTAVLMVGVLAVIADLGAAGMEPTRALEADATFEDDALAAWLSLLREDLEHAMDVDVPRPGVLVLTGYGALDGSRRERTHRPVRVRYTVEEVGGRAWLVRRQAALDVLSNRHVQRDLVCSGVVRFALEAVGSTATRRGVASAPTAAEATRTGGADAASEAAPGTGAAPAGAVRAPAAGTRAPPADPATPETPAPQGAERPEGVVINHLHYYLKYAPHLYEGGPESAPAETSEAPTAPAADTAIATAGASGAPGAGGAVAPTEAPAARRRPRPRDVPWWLRVWTDPATEAPTYERLVTIRTDEPL